MNLTLRDYRLSVAQCAVLEQSLMYHDLEHKNIHYCDGTNLKDIISGKTDSTDEDIASGKTPIIGHALIDMAIVD